MLLLYVLRNREAVRYVLSLPNVADLVQLKQVRSEIDGIADPRDLISFSEERCFFDRGDLLAVLLIDFGDHAVRVLVFSKFLGCLVGNSDRFRISFARASFLE